MTKMRDWQRNRELWVRVLEKHTGEGLAAWNRKIGTHPFGDERQLRRWLSKQGVTGYAQQLLVMERFGYPDFVLATADDLIGKHTRIARSSGRSTTGSSRPPTHAARSSSRRGKLYVSLVSPRRTFARVQATTKTRVDLGLRLDGQPPAGRLRPSRIHETMRLQISLTSPRQIDSEVRRWLRRAYTENA